MQKLRNTSLSASNLKNQKHGGLMEIDSPIPISVKDLIPQGNTTITMFAKGGPKTETELRNEEFWKMILESK